MGMNPQPGRGSVAPFLRAHPLAYVHFYRSPPRPNLSTPAIAQDLSSYPPNRASNRAPSLDTIRTVEAANFSGR